MQPGRELDALMAKEIMELDVEPSSNYDGFYGDLIPVGDRTFVDPQGWVYDKGKEPVPCYSTDIAAAWEVVEKLYADGFWADLRTPWDAPGSEANLGHSCGFTPFLTTGWNGIPDHWTQAETMPHAICLAALKVKGIEIDA